MTYARNVGLGASEDRIEKPLAERLLIPCIDAVRRAAGPAFAFAPIAEAPPGAQAAFRLQ